MTNQQNLDAIYSRIDKWHRDHSIPGATTESYSLQLLQADAEQLRRVIEITAQLPWNEETTP